MRHLQPPAIRTCGSGLWSDLNDFKRSLRALRSIFPLCELVKPERGGGGDLHRLFRAGAGRGALDRTRCPARVHHAGRAGVLARRGSEVLRIPAPKVEVVDTTGAGDGFVAGLLSKLARPEAKAIAESTAAELEAALKFACAVGSRVCTQVGAVAALPYARRDLSELCWALSACLAGHLDRLARVLPQLERQACLRPSFRRLFKMYIHLTLDTRVRRHSPSDGRCRQADQAVAGSAFSRDKISPVSASAAGHRPHRGRAGPREMVNPPIAERDDLRDREQRLVEAEDGPLLVAADATG